MQLTLSKKEKKLKPPQPKYVLNLANYDKKKVNVPLSIGITLLVILAIAAFAKFAVFDRFAALDKAQAQAASLQAQIDSNYRQIQELSGVTEEYAHYTYSGMSADELALVSRVDIMDMISRLVVPYATVNSWSLQGNTLTMSINNTTLARINQIVASVNAEPIVNYSFMQTAATENGKEILPGSEVSAQLTVYLQIPTDTGEGEVTE